MGEGRTLKPVCQAEIGQGRTYLTREWNVLHLARAVRFVESGALARWVLSGKPGMSRVRLIDAVDDEPTALKGLRAAS